ncbi:hypothetical protein BD414DRAFT_64817 [Trametes punicea]|nr:hypothetical protein BD414DRAFT_64817 [Trametes punicea]
MWLTTSGSQPQAACPLSSGYSAIKSPDLRSKAKQPFCRSLTFANPHSAEIILILCHSSGAGMGTGRT